MLTPILQIKRSDGPGALARYTLTPAEVALCAEMEAAVACLPPRSALSACHQAVATVGARRGLDRLQSIALWTRGALRMFEPSMSAASPTDASQYLQRLIAVTFEEAAAAARPNGDFSPFLIHIGSGPPSVLRFPDAPRGDDGDADSNELMADVRQAAARLGLSVHSYAIASVQAPPGPARPTRTVFVEGADRVAASGHLYAQGFTAPSRLGPFEPSQPFERIGDARNLFSR